MSYVGFTCGAFDLLHPGHILLFEEARKHCQYLIVGLHVDPSLERPYKNKPIQSVFERFIQLKGCLYIDEIIPYETDKDLLNILATQSINIRFLDESYAKTPELIVGKLFFDIKLFYTKRKHNFSSTELRDRIKAETDADK